MSLRDCAIGAIIAASIFAGANAGSPAKPVAAAPVQFHQSGEVAVGMAVLRFGVGQVLDIAGGVIALAKRI